MLKRWQKWIRFHIWLCSAKSKLNFSLTSLVLLLLLTLLRFLTVFSRCLGHSRLPVQRILSVHWPGRQGELKNRTHTELHFLFSLLTSQQAKGILMTYQTGYCESSQHYVNCPPKLLNTKAIYEADHLQGKQTWGRADMTMLWWLWELKCCQSYLPPTPEWFLGKFALQVSVLYSPANSHYEYPYCLLDYVKVNNLFSFCFLNGIRNLRAVKTMHKIRHFFLV